MDESRKSRSPSSDAGKIDPRFAQGELVRVGYARNQAESDLLQNMLLEEGIPSMIKRTAGFDVPDFLAAGPRDIYVPQSGAVAAREFLNEVWAGGASEESPRSAVSARILLGVLGGGLVASLVAWLLSGGGS